MLRISSIGRIALAGSALVLAGCEGALSFEPGDLDALPDAAHVDGAIAPPTDAGTRDASASPTDAGMPADGSVPPTPDSGATPIDGGPPDPCATVTCGAHAHCQAGSCRCDDGFVDAGGTCVAPTPGDPATRPQAEVCMRWNEGHVENASPAWTAGATTCDTGTLSPVAIEDTLRRIATFRWLAGLPPVSHDDSDHAGMMECAHLMNANNALSHEPPTTWNCYTAAAASAAGRSNIALGYPTPGAAIDGYMRDRGTMSLGHRRWILGASLGSVEIGFAGRGQCLGVFRGGGSTDRTWTAYPNEGFAPMQLATDAWSFQAYAFSLTSSTTVRVVRLSDGMTMPTAHFLTGGFGPPPAIGWTNTGWTPAAGETYRVTIAGTSMGDVTYDVKLVDC